MYNFALKMTKEELVARLRDIEWDDFEVKAAKSDLPKNIWETVSAFSNCSGGWIVLGVKQSGRLFEIVGVDNIEKLEQDFFWHPPFQEVQCPSLCHAPSLRDREQECHRLLSSVIRSQAGLFRRSRKHVHPHGKRRPTCLPAGNNVDDSRPVIWHPVAEIHS